MENNNTLYTAPTVVVPNATNFIETLRNNPELADELAKDPDAALHTYCYVNKIDTKALDDIICTGKPDEQYKAIFEKASPKTQEIFQKRAESVYAANLDELPQVPTNTNEKHIYEMKPDSVLQETTNSDMKHISENKTNTSKAIGEASAVEKPLNKNRNVGKIEDVNDAEEPYQIWVRDFDKNMRIYDRIDIPRDSALEDWILSAIEQPFMHFNKLAGQWRGYHLKEMNDANKMFLEDCRGQMTAESGPFKSLEAALKRGDIDAFNKIWARDIESNDFYLTGSQKKQADAILKNINVTLKDIPEIEKTNKAKAEQKKKEAENLLKEAKEIFGGRHSHTRVVPQKQRTSQQNRNGRDR